MPVGGVALRTAATAGALLLAACGGNAGPSARTTTTSPTPSPAPVTTSGGTTVTATPSPSTGTTTAVGTGTVITTAGSRFGTMLFDRTGQAIYLFDRERTSRPDCYGACAAAWPPVLTTATPRAGGQVRAGLLGVTRRTDGSTQVTYAGHPLYFYAHEGKRQVLCHGVSEYGGLWLVVRPDGSAAPA